MRTDLRVKHDIDARKKAAELFGKGRGFESVAKELSIPRSTVRRWQQIWKAFGSEALLSMDGRQARHTCSQKVAAAKAVVEDGMSKSDAMARYGIMSLAPLERWCRACREGGAEALRPKPKGRPKGSGAAARPLTREQQLGRRVQQLEAEVAYLKKLRSLAGRGRIRPGRRQRPCTLSHRRDTGSTTSLRQQASRGRRTTMRSPILRSPPGRSSGSAWPGYSRAAPTDAATGRWPCACEGRTACA